MLFDYGGVLAEEGFREGLYAIAESQGFDGDEFYRAAQEGVYDTGYVTGEGSVTDFWHYLRQRFPLQGDDDSLSDEVLSRFLLRPAMPFLVRRLRRKAYAVGILSDQTEWLDQLDQRDHFYREFDRLYISYRLGKGKRDASLFDDVAADLGLDSAEIIFIDDNAGNVERACERGMQGLLFTTMSDLLRELEIILGQPLDDGSMQQGGFP